MFLLPESVQICSVAKLAMFSLGNGGPLLMGKAADV